MPTTLFYPVWHTIARENLHTKTRIATGQCLSREDALRAATIEGAWLTFEEKQKGSLEVGKLADLVILDKNPLTVDQKMIKDIKVIETIKEGKSIYSVAAR